jgi:hypothetical protein
LILHAGEVLGLPPGVPSAVYDVGWWRDLLVVAALAAAWCEARGRRTSALAFAIVFAVLATGFWAVALARPYGVLVDPPTTAWAADVAVAGWSGGGERFIAGESGEVGIWPVLAHHVRPDLLLLAPTVLPVFVLPAGALAIAGLWGRRSEACFAGILWLGASTGGLETLRGLGFVRGLWSRPLSSLLWVATVAAVLVCVRVRSSWRWSVGLGLAVVFGWALLGRRGPAVSLADASLSLTLDNHLWFLLGIAGLWRTREPAAGALALGGTGLALTRALGAPGDAWAGAAFCRLGLILAASEFVVTHLAILLRAPGPGIVTGALARWRVGPESLARGAVVALVLAGGYLAWWDPPRTDEIAKDSLEPVPEALVAATEWIRRETPRDAVVLADPQYAAAVSVLGGRRVLRAPGLVVAPDEERRIRLQRAVLAGRAPAALLKRYGLRYLFIAPGQFRENGIEQPEDLDRIAGLRLAYASPKGIRVYEIAPAAVEAHPAGGAGDSEPIK